jgi:hypothetical protein
LNAPPDTPDVPLLLDTIDEVIAEVEAGIILYSHPASDAVPRDEADTPPIVAVTPPIADAVKVVELFPGRLQ